MSLLRLSPNQTRLLYDGSVFVASALAAAVIALLFTGRLHAALVALPAVGLLSNHLLGVHSRFRLSSAWVKTAVLTATTGIVAALVLAAVGDARVALLWAALAWPALVLPRFFLGINRWGKVSAFGKTLAGVLKERGPVLVVGGAGYIGSHVVRELLAEGHSVRILDRLFYGAEPLGELADDPRVELIEGDVTDIARLVAALDGAWAVVHLAGLVGDPACAVDDRYTLHCNIIATRMLRDVSESFGVRRFVFASSCSVYGESEAVVDETSPTRAISLYAQTKLESENELLSVLRDDFFVTVLRFATVFGHSRRPRFDLVANLFAAQAYFDGRITVDGGAQVRPFIHVQDVARAVAGVLRADPERVQGQVFNVGDERLNATIGEVAELARRIVSAERPVEIEVRGDVADRRNYRVAFRKIREVLGFEASRTLEGGMRELVEEFRSGHYADYRHPRYSNVEVTRQQVLGFHDPMQRTRLYTPLSSVES